LGSNWIVFISEVKPQTAHFSKLLDIFFITDRRKIFYLKKNFICKLQFKDFSDYRSHFAGGPLSPFKDASHKFYVLGGPQPLTAEAFDGNTWTVVAPPLPFTIYVSCMVYLNSTAVMLISGVQGTQLTISYSTKTLTMNSEYKTWTEGPPINVPRYGHGCGRIVQSQKSTQFSTIIAGGVSNGVKTNQGRML
jgi:hypothetical protein